jgi:hypothetical protein
MSMRIQAIKTWWAFTLFILPALVLSLAAQQSNSLIISGQQGSATVIQVEGRSYVEVEGLARLTNSSIGFNGAQIILTMPSPAADAPRPAVPTSGFSKDFVTTGIEAMAQIREWRAALKTAVDRGYPVSENWLATYRARAQQALRLASVAVNTAADKNALPFLTNEFNNMRKLSDKYVQMTVSMTYIAPNSLDTDPLDQKIRTCAHSLASMATANQFVDDGSCQ